MLLDQQRAFSAALLAGESGASQLAGLIDEVLLGRIAVYRNNVLGNLTGALRLTYPAVLRLVGKAFFDHAAQRFIAFCLPQSADLYAYGAGFGAFLEGFEPARELAYLPDVARLEFAVCRALHAPRATVLDPVSLAGAGALEGVRFTPHPALALLRLQAPVRAIWEAVLAPETPERATALAAIEITATPEHFAVVNPAGAVELLAFDAAGLGFAESLARGASLGDALAHSPEVDAAALLARLFNHGFFTAARLS
jgi:hypothetical protein